MPGKIKDTTVTRLKAADFQQNDNGEKASARMHCRILLIVSLWLSGASYLYASGVHLSENEVDARVEAAGCFIPTPKGVVLGISTLFRNIHLPMGSHEPGETARETAARETLEETGLEVVVGPVVRTFESDTVFLFFCTPKTPIEDYTKLRSTDVLEIAEVIVLDPATMLNHSGRKIGNPWRFPEDRKVLMELFEKYKNNELAQ